MSNNKNLMIDALAAHRITHFITDDYLATPAREYIRHRHGEDSKLYYLVNCPWCTSIYVGAGIALARTLMPRTWSVIGTALALSSAAALIQTHEGIGLHDDYHGHTVES